MYTTTGYSETLVESLELSAYQGRINQVFDP